MNFMKIAAEEAHCGITNGEGGPFGAVIVKDGKIIGQGHNRVVADHDPTMHGEVAAIRNACKNIASHDLSGCVLYTTAYPCPLCMSAAMWANIEKIVYGCTVRDTTEIGFRDEQFYEALKNGTEVIPLECEEREECLKVFDEYVKLKGKKY